MLAPRTGRAPARLGGSRLRTCAGIERRGRCRLRHAALVRDQGNAHYLYGRGIAALRLGRTQEGQADLAAARAADSAVAASYESYGVTP